MRVYKRGNTWTYAFDIKVNGKRKTISKGGFRLKSEAEHAGVLAQSDSKKGIQVYKTVNMTYNQYLDMWLYDVYKATVKPTTFRQRISLFNNFVRPVIGDINVNEITTADISNLLNSLVANGNVKSLISSVRAILSKSFNDMIAVYGYTQYNPVTHAIVNTRLIRDNDKSKHGFIISFEQIEQIRNFLLKNSYSRYMLFEVGLRCGLRFSEAAGLTWDDIDFEKKELNINKQLKSNDKIYSIVMDSPKFNSTGTIDLDDELVMMLKKYKLWQNEEYLKNGRSRTHIIYNYAKRDFYNYDLVFLNARLNCYEHGSRDYFNKIIQTECNIPRFSYHCLRRTHATLLIANNAPIKAVQERLRHKRIDETLNIYTQVNESMKNKLNDILNGDLYAHSKTCKQNANK